MAQNGTYSERSGQMAEAIFKGVSGRLHRFSAFAPHAPMPAGTGCLCVRPSRRRRQRLDHVVPLANRQPFPAHGAPRTVGRSPASGRDTHPDPPAPRTGRSRSGRSRSACCAPAAPERSGQCCARHRSAREGRPSRPLSAVRDGATGESLTERRRIRFCVRGRFRGLGGADQLDEFRAPSEFVSSPRALREREHLIPAIGFV